MFLTRKKLLAGLAWATLAVLCWAPLFSIAKRTLPYIDPFTLATVRYVAGVTLFVLLLVAVEGRAALRFEQRLLAATGAGLLGITGFNLFIWTGMLYTVPEHATVIAALQTPLIALAVWAWRGPRPATFTLACVMLALAGTVLVVTKGVSPAAIDARVLLGDFLVFLGALCWIGYTLAVAHAFPGWSPLRTAVLTSIPGMAGLVAGNVLALAAGWARLPGLETLSSLGWQIAYLAICSVVLGVLGFNNAARTLGPLDTMLMLNAIPVLVFAIEASLGRSFAAVELIGAAIVVGSLVANNLYLRGVSTRR